MSNIETLSKTDEERLKVANAHKVLSEVNSTRITDEAVAVVVKHSGVSDGSVYVAGKNGAERLGAGDRPMTFRALIEEILLGRGEDARAIRWKEFGRPV